MATIVFSLVPLARTHPCKGPGTMAQLCATDGEQTDISEFWQSVPCSNLVTQYSGKFLAFSAGQRVPHGHAIYAEAGLPPSTPLHPGLWQSQWGKGESSGHIAMLLLISFRSHWADQGPGHGNELPHCRWCTA